MNKIVFDLKRINTVISYNGRVHISNTAGKESLCGRSGYNWQENLDDKQPDCRTCVRIAVLHPTIYFFTEE